MNIRKIQNWHPTKNIRANTFDIFEHKGEVYSSESKDYFFHTEEELEEFLAAMKARAVEGGPITVHVRVSDYEPGRYLDPHEFRNDHYWDVELPARYREANSKRRAA